MGSNRRRLGPEARRQEILEAAERLLKKHGVAVRVEDVVREAGAAKGTFYLYFPAWDDLLEAIRSRLVRGFDEAHRGGFGVPGERNWPDVLGGLAEAFVDAVVAMGGLHAVLFHTDFARRRPVPESDDPVRRLTGIIRAGREAEAFAEVDAEATARLLFAVIHETADAVEAGEDRGRALAAMQRVLRKVLEPEVG